jgi:glycosyltransferase involved in cell wall biosynthesis
MKIVWCSWKDKKHPLAGGAELVSENILRRLAAHGHEVILLTSSASGLPTTERMDGYTVIRRGSRYTVHLNAMRYYKKHLRGWADLVVDEINTAPFFARYWVHVPNVIFIHQLARQVWFYEMPKPFSWIGYAVEPLYLRSLAKTPAITVSNSTKKDLERCGFHGDAISVVREGVTLTPIADPAKVTKYDRPTLLALGALRPMKRTLHIVKAFNVARQQIPNLQLIIAGDTSDPYAREVMGEVAGSPYQSDISVLGRVGNEKKSELMQRSHIQAVASIKEGWGLTVTEANSQGTPVAAYNVDGLRDSVQDGVTGLITDPNPTALGEGIATLLKDSEAYERIRIAAWQDSKQYHFDNTYNDFVAAIHDRLDITL